jgi:hypothetical protein
VHKIQYANTATTTTILQPYLYCWAQNTNAESTSNVNMQLCCFSAFVEGNPTFNGPKFGIDNNKSINTNLYIPILTIRNKTIFNSKTNRISVYMRNLSASSDSRQCIFALYKNSILTGAVYTNINNNNSIVEYDTTASALTGGTLMFSFCIGPGAALNQVFNLYEISIEPGETLTMSARVPSAQPTVSACALNWVEDQ